MDHDFEYVSIEKHKILERQIKMLVRDNQGFIRAVKYLLLLNILQFILHLVR